MNDIQTYSPDKDTDDSFRKDKERILTRYALELLPEFRSKIFGAKLKPEDSCIESADAEELLALISELHSYRASLVDGIDQLRLTSAELEIVPMPLWCFARRRELRLQSIKTEQAALFQQALRKQASKAEPAQLTRQELSPAKSKKKQKAEQHAIHQEKQKRFEFLKRKVFYELVVTQIGYDLFDDLMNQASKIAEKEQAAECLAEPAP